MNMTWDLEIMYKGYDDPKYIADNNRVLEIIKEINALVNELDVNKAVLCIEKELRLEEELNSVLSELFSYSSLRASTNVNDYEALGEMGKLQMVLQETVAASVAFSKFLTNVDLDKLSLESELIKTYLFILKSNQEEASHTSSLYSYPRNDYIGHNALCGNPEKRKA